MATATAVPSFSLFFPTLFPTKSPPQARAPQQLKLGKNTSFTSLKISPISVSNAKTLIVKSGFNTQIKVEDNESEDRIAIRFKRAVWKAGVLYECKRRRFFESSQEKKKRKAREAARRNRKRRPQPRVQPKQDAAKKKNKDQDEDDNWELPEGDIPYC